MRIIEIFYPHDEAGKMQSKVNQLHVPLYVESG